jgi:two-component system sensor histidine kinase BarA
MPEVDGFQATVEIRRLERDSQHMKARVPILALTASAMASDREHCFAFGMDGSITKPTRPDELRAPLQNVVSGATLAT